MLFVAAMRTISFQSQCLHLWQRIFSKAKEFKLKYMLGSCMYGYGKIEDILPEVAGTGATAIDIWPKVHGNQREQLDAMGEDRFRELLNEQSVQLGCITQYRLSLPHTSMSQTIYPKRVESLS